MPILQPYIYLYSIVLLAFLLCIAKIELSYRDVKISSILEQEKHVRSFKKVDLICFFTVSIIVLLFTATRDVTVGTDTATYVAFFKHPSFLYHGAKTDLFFEYYGRALRLLIGKSQQGFIFISALFAYFGVFFIIWKTSKQKMYSLLLFMIMGTSSIFFFLYLCMIRQITAITYFMLAIYFLFEYKASASRKTILFLIFYISAVLTHGSCLFTLPFIFITYYKPILNKNIWLAVILGTYIMSALGISIVGDILELVFGLLESEHYSAYANVGFGMIEQKGWINMNLLPFMVLAFFILYICPSKKISDFRIQFALFSVVLNNLFYDNLMWSRLILYFSLFMIIAIPNATFNKSKIYQFSTITFILVYYLYKTTSQLIQNASFTATGNIFVPYKSWLF